MKINILRVFLLAVFWLIISVFLYPFVHELGHVIMCFLVDAHIFEVSFFPIPSVIFSTQNVSNLQLFLIGISGVTLPLLLVFFIPKKWFLSWFLSLSFKAISALAFFISFMSILMGINIDDDMVKIQSLDVVSEHLLITIICLILLLIIGVICREKPLKKIEKFII